MLAIIKNKLAVKIALTMAIPLLVNFALYGEMQRQLVSLESMTQELQTRRQIADQANRIVIANYFALQSLMQYKFFNREADKNAFKDHLQQFTSEFGDLAKKLKSRGDEKLGRRLEVQGQDYIGSISGSQFSPDIHNQVGSFFDDLEQNVRLKQATIRFLLTLKEIGRKVQADVDSANQDEERSREAFRQFSQFAMVANSLVALIVAFILGILTVRRINVVKANSERLAKGMPLLAPQQSEDEIGVLDKTFRDMATALDDAREKEKFMMTIVQESKEELEIVIDKIPAAIFITDQNGKVESLNKVACSLFLLDMHYFGSDGIDKIFVLKKAERSSFFAKLCSDASQKPVQITAIDSANEVLPVAVSVTPFAVFGHDKYLLTIVDETEKLMLEQAKADFFSMVSHDMRTPLTSITGVLQLAVNDVYGELSDQAKTKLELANTNAKVLLDMMNNLLKIGKIESTNLDLTLEVFDFSELACEVAALIDPQLEPKSLQLNKDTSPCELEGDRHYLLEVLMNLMTNAIKYSPQDGKLNLVCKPDNGSVLFELSDQGLGIPDDKKEKVFERFAQADSKRNRNTSFGLGLAICKKIIQQHGGKIGVSDADGGGSKFWLKLPAHAANHLSSR